MASYMDYEFQQLVYTFNEKAEGISSWKEYLEGLTKQQTSDIEIATQQASYDISGAYANYKKSQLNLLQNRQLGAGFKEQLDSDLKSSYASAYGKVQSQLASNISNIASQYDKLRSDAQKTIQESSSYLDAVNRALYDYMEQDISKRGETKEKGGLQYYETDAEGITRLTGYGKANLGHALLSPNKSGKLFSDYLAETDKKTYDWFMENMDLAYGAIAGLDQGTRSFDAKERDAMIAAEDAERRYSNYVGGDYDKSVTFDTEKDRQEYYTNAYYDAKYEKQNIEKNISNFTNKYSNYDKVFNHLKRRSHYDITKEYLKDFNSVLLNGAAYYDERAVHNNKDRSLGAIIQIDPSKLTDYELKVIKSLDHEIRDNGHIQLHVVTDESDIFSNDTPGYTTYDKVAKVIQKLKRGA